MHEFLQKTFLNAFILLVCLFVACCEINRHNECLYVKPRWLDVIIRQLLTNNLGGRGIESRRQLFCRANDLDAQNKRIWKQNKKQKQARPERPLTRERARSKNETD